MGRLMMKLGVFVVLAVAASVPLSGQIGAATTSSQPFKLGTFEIEGEQESGSSCRTSSSWSSGRQPRARAQPAYPRLPMPDTMLDLIGQYEYGLKFRLYEIVNDIVGQQAAGGDPRPRYIHEVAQVRTLAPILVSAQDPEHRREFLQPRR